jgi:hypothetical protein
MFEGKRLEINRVSEGNLLLLLLPQQHFSSMSVFSAGIFTAIGMYERYVNQKRDLTLVEVHNTKILLEGKKLRVPFFFLFQVPKAGFCSSSSF